MFNRGLYDSCNYQKRLEENQGMLGYNLDSNKFYNCNQKRVDFGLLGGNNVSQSTDNLVDLESDLRNITRLYSKCPEKKYIPRANGMNIMQCGNVNGYPLGDPKCQPRMHHMQETSMIDFKPRYDNTGLQDISTQASCLQNPTMFTYSATGQLPNNAARFGMMQTY
jgi:hypothetical protein